MELKFTKMHGLGNDFIIVDAFDNEINLTKQQVQSMADRHFGIGFDQLLLLSRPGQTNADVNYRIFNSDGGEVSQCGNGARCVAAYLHASGRVKKDEIVAETREGILQLYRLDNGQVRVNMGVPVLEPKKIPLQAEKRTLHYPLKLNQHTLEFNAVSMGNPHAVITVADVDNAAVTELGPQIQKLSMFPESVNVGFMQIIDATHIKLRVYERGAGETLACGSGACAAVVAGILEQRLKNQVTVSLPGGDLLVSWEGEGESVWITGPATTVYEGRIVI